ncbi:MAG: hypothetical protein H7228_04785 [Polaromonas sp.]|nr:hypothetical protein [Polaromonas sp.]
MNSSHQSLATLRTKVARSYSPEGDYLGRYLHCRLRGRDFYRASGADGHQSAP